MSLKRDGRAIACGDSRFGECVMPDLPDGVTYTQVPAGDTHIGLLKATVARELVVATLVRLLVDTKKTMWSPQECLLRRRKATSRITSRQLWFLYLKMNEPLRAQKLEIIQTFIF